MPKKVGENMSKEATSVGSVQFEVKFSKDSINKEIQKLNSMLSGNDITKGIRDSMDAFSKSISGSINSFSKGINDFIKNDIEKLNKSIQDVVTSLDAIKNPPKADIPETEVTSSDKAMEKSFINPFSKISIFMKNTMSKMGEEQRAFAQVGVRSNEKVSQSVNKMNAEYEKASAKIAEIRNELSKLFAEQDSIVRTSQDMPAFSGMTKEASIEQMLKANPRYNELSGQIDALSAKLDPLVEKNKKLADEIKNVGDEAQNTGNNLNKIGDGTKKAGNEAKKSSFRIKLFGDEMKKSGVKAAGFAAMINRSFMTILKRLFIYNLILKSIRSLMVYMGSALKTNREYSKSLNQIKTNLRVAFQPIYDFILPAINALMRGLATATTYIATAISAMFGKTYKQSYDAAKGLDDAKKKMEGYGKATKKATGALAGFDEINQLDIQDDEESGGAASGEFEMTMPEVPNIDISGVDKFKEALQPTIESLQILGLALEPLKNFVAKGLQDFYNNFLMPVGQWTLGEGLPRFIDAITKGLMGVNWEVINASLGNLWCALTPFAINVGEGLLWFWENVLTPLGAWTMNEIVPRFLDILAEAIRVLNVTIDALKPLALWLWENFLKPLAEWTGGIIVSVLEGIKDALNGISDWIKNNQRTVENMSLAIGSFMTAWVIVDLAVKIGGIVTALKTFIVTGGLATLITTGFGAAIAFLTSPITIAVAIIGSLIAIGVLLYKNWDEVKAFLLETWEKIKAKALEIWTAVAEFLSKTWEAIKTKVIEIWNSIKEFFVKVWESIKTTAIGIWNGIKDYTVTKWNEIKDFLSKLWDGIKDSFKKVWESMKELLPALLQGILNVMKTSYDMFKNIGKELFNMVWEGMKNIWSSITGWITEKVEWLKDKLMFWKKGQEEMSSGGGGSSADQMQKRSEDMTENKDSIIKYAEKNRINGDMNLLYDMWQAGGAPKLARGGIIDQPTLAMVGERGKEAVIPFENSGFLEALTDSILSAFMQVLPLLQGGNNDRSSYDDRELIFNIDGVKLIRVLLPKINDELIRLGYRPIYQYE